MSSKKWPKDPKQTVRFADLAEPVHKAISFAYTLKRKNHGKDVPWSGFDIGESMKACCLSPHEALTKDNLAYDKNNQDRDPMNILIGIAIQIGIEQGRRIQLEEIDSYLSLASISAKQTLESINNLTRRLGIGPV